MTVKLIAIDPGPVESAWVIWDGSSVKAFRKEPNEKVIEMLGDVSLKCTLTIRPLVIEKIASFGMPVGAEVFETVYWSGRFAERFGAERTYRITRNEVKNHLCHSSRASDGNIRQAIIDRFGGKDVAIGKKATAGPLYGLSGDHWSALAVAITWWDRNALEANSQAKV